MSLSRWAASKTAAKLSASTNSISHAPDNTLAAGSDPQMTSPTATAISNNNNAHLTSVIAPFLNPRLSTSSINGLVAPPPPLAAPSPTSPRSPTFQQQHHLFDSASDGPGDQVWDTIESRVLPLFIGEGLNSTVEEINFLLSRYLSQQLYGTILEELKDLLREGVSRLMAKFLTPDVTFPDPPPSTSAAAAPVPASQSKYLVRWTEIWTFYFSVVLPYLQSVFLPLQAEIKGSRLVNSVRTLVLLAFRDRAVLPHVDSIQALVSALALEFSSASRTAAGVRMSTLSLASLSPGAAAAPATAEPSASTTATPVAETRIAQLQQMLLVLGDLPTGGPGGAGASAGGGADEVKVRLIKAMQVPVKAVVARVRAQVAAVGAAAAAGGGGVASAS